jgi:hypothetical protein
MALSLCFLGNHGSFKEKYDCIATGGIDNLSDYYVSFSCTKKEAAWKTMENNHFKYS